MKTVNQINGFITELSGLQNRWLIFIEDSVDKIKEDNLTLEEDKFQSDTSATKLKEEENLTDKKRKNCPATRGSRLNKAEYRIPILQVLNSMGEKAMVRDILKNIFEIIEPKLKDLDFEPLSNNELRWQNAAKWERFNMVNEGLLAKESAFGIWEITDKGRNYLSEHIKIVNNP